MTVVFLGTGGGIVPTPCRRRWGRDRKVVPGPLVTRRRIVSVVDVRGDLRILVQKGLDEVWGKVHGLVY